MWRDRSPQMLAFFAGLLLAAAPGAGEGFLKTSRSGDLIVEFVSSEAGFARMELGLGTPDESSAASQRKVALIHDQGNLVTPAIVNLGFFPAGSEIDFYMVGDYAGVHWAFSRNLANKPTPADLATFRDTDLSLGRGGSIIEKRGPDDWILHLDDPVSFQIDDDDNDIVVRVRIEQTGRKPRGIYEHPGGLHSSEQILVVKKKIEKGEEPFNTAYKRLIADADASRKRPPHAVEQFRVPLASRDAQGHSTAVERLGGDGFAAYSCALAWQLSQKQEYAEKAREFLNAWATTNTRCAGSSDDGDNHESTLVMAYAGVALVHAAELISDFDGWTPAERAAFERWLRSVFVPACLDRTVEEKAGNHRTNWALLGLTAAYYFLDAREDVRTLIDWLKLEIARQIDADGHLPAETRHGKLGMWYTYFALAPLTAACQIIWNAEGVDLFRHTVDQGGKTVSIQTALDAYLRYCRRPGQWPWHEKNDLVRPAADFWPGNLYEAMSGIYADPKYENYARPDRPHVVKNPHQGWTFPTLMRPLSVHPPGDD